MTLLHLDASIAPDRDLLGGKAASIVRLAHLGISVPPAFALTTDECDRYYAQGRAVPDDVARGLPTEMRRLESATGRTFGGGERPLLVSVRSGAAESMPGMMDTILNLGITPGVEHALSELTGSASYAADTRRRFEEQFEKVVGRRPPSDPWDQLAAAIAAVFDSWQSRRAVAYRKDRGLNHVGGTAVTVQAMVFGNLDERSGTGVLFTRNPTCGSPEPLGEWLPMGQGEDVVSGNADPLPISDLANTMPDIHRELLEAAYALERHERDVQDVEFTIESGRLWLLQARAAKRSPDAAIRLAVLLQREGLLSKTEALDRVSAEHVDAMERPHVDPEERAGARLLAEGRPASPGVVTGTVVTDPDDAEARALNGEAVVLGRPTTNPDDVHAMAVVSGIVTEIGGATSHAAVVSRELGVPCIVGCGEAAVTTLEGCVVTLDAAAGELFEGALPVRQASEADDADLATLLEWARAEAGDGNRAPLAELLRARAQGL